METEEIKTVRTFNEAINTANAELLSSLMTEDHTFIDSAGTMVVGKEKMTEGWKGFWATFPDYRNEFEVVLQQDNMVVAFGTSHGTYNGKRGLVPENRIEMPAAWKAIVENGKIKLWQVYADWTAGSKIVEEDEKSG